MARPWIFFGAVETTLAVPGYKRTTGRAFACVSTTWIFE